MSAAQRTTLSVGGLGEAGILRILHRRFATVPGAQDWPAGTVGPGDDAAVVTAPDGRYVITIDAMAQDRDFRLAWPAVPDASGRVGAGFASGYSTGWKAAAQNLSDLNAMSGVATGLLLALTMPPSTPVTWVDGLAAGLAGAVQHLGAVRCRIVGGDLGSGEQIGLAVTATGDLEGRPAMLRTIHDPVESADLVLCGRAGWAAAGLAVLETPRRELLDRLDAASVRRLAALAAAAQLRPRPVLGAGRTAAQGGALAMMDVSDGLQRDVGRLADANGMQAELDPDWVAREAKPLEVLARALGQDAHHWVTAGGEDYGLLAALPSGAVIPPGFRRIGRLTAVGAGREGPGRDGNPDGGWDHFDS
ncbi:thiamine-monophosphate kinase [Citricoccus sp. GCM10030269]|uniref:thiamine-phosphate kinase n=1 Tax=Citricoccus sp. GCM10030269 TaxID=3273388 RepID=UPI00361994A0